LRPAVVDITAAYSPAGRAVDELRPAALSSHSACDVRRSGSEDVLRGSGSLDDQVGARIDHHLVIVAAAALANGRIRDHADLGAIL